MIEVPNIGTISDSTNRESNANPCTQTPQIKEAIKSIISPKCATYNVRGIKVNNHTNVVMTQKVLSKMH